MYKKISLVLLSLMLVGCKSIGIPTGPAAGLHPPDSNVWIKESGTGALELDTVATDKFKLGYLPIGGSKLYMVRSDGSKGVVIACRKDNPDCRISLSTLNKARRNCISETNFSCAVFAVGDKIVWNGKISYADDALSSGMSYTSTPDSVTFVHKPNFALSDEEAALAGHGNLELSTTQFRALYAFSRKKDAGYFLIPDKGDGLVHVGCVKGTGTCSPDNELAKALDFCQKRNLGARCNLFAKERQLVWNGAITIPKISPPNKLRKNN